MNRQGKARTRRPIIILLILLVIFLVPIAIAWLLYANDKTLGGGTVNHGQLIQPPFAVSTLKLKTDQGKLLDNAQPKPTKLAEKIAPPSPTRTNGKWLILLLCSRPGDQSCQQGLYKMRQIRLATGKDQKRVERAILTYQNAMINPNLNKALQRYMRTRHLVINKNQFDQVIVNKVKQPYALASGTIYIVDPLGNVMISYKPNANPRNIFKDMERLLQVSHIG